MNCIGEGGIPLRLQDRQELRNLLIKHYAKYPKMELQDIIKLIYQNEFAGGHMIIDEEGSLKRLQEEVSGLELNFNDSMSNDMFDEIGNGLCRFYLTAIRDSGIDIKTVNTFFINTANSVYGDIKSFEKKLKVVKECCRDGFLPYPLKRLEIYLDDYRSKGYPPVSHSKIYRNSYLPAYRVVKAKYCYYFEVFSRIDSLLKTHATVNVAIEGNACAGKTTLANVIGEVYDCNIFHMDDFFLRPELKTADRLNEVGGNVDYVRFQQEIIEGLKKGMEFQYQVYDCKKMILDRYVSVQPKRLNIIEGVYSMHPTLIDNYDLKIFLSIDEKEQSERILKRNGAVMQRRFLEEWIPLENRYFKEMAIKDKSDLIFR